jgi:hypothetical protein
MKPMPSVLLGRYAGNFLNCGSGRGSFFNRAVPSALNMTVIGITSGAVSLCLFAVKSRL